MAIATNPEKSAAAPPAKQYDYLAGVLSYLVPGLGQIYRGRTAKGVLFLVCIYVLFFYGLFLGSGSAHIPEGNFYVSGSVYLPDTTQPGSGSNPVVTNLYNRPQFIGQFCAGVVSWPAVWQYLHYDRSQPDRPDPIFGRFMQAPTLRDLNAVQSMDPKGKVMDLAWVFTVIAGVLNVMVIYDAVAGPAFPIPPPSSRPEVSHEHTAA